jgi:hypothetical protein
MSELHQGWLMGLTVIAAAFLQKPARLPKIYSGAE